MKAALALALLVATAALAGCSDKGSNSSGGGGGGGDEPPLKAGKGAISGLLIDDRFRPLAGGLLLLQPLGETAMSDANGEFTFANLEPDSYVVRATLEGHEAAPAAVQVEEGVYSELQVMARRVFSDDGQIISTEYSVFVPCAVSVPVASANVDCTFDGSGDTFRFGFFADYTSYGQNITYMITEMKANKKASPESGAYKVVVRSESGGDPYYASAFTLEGDYIRVVNKLGERSPYDTEDRNVNWTNDEPLQTALFPQGAFKGETQEVQNTSCSNTGQGCFESRGVGPQIGIKAQFVQTVFIGIPAGIDPETYAVLAPSE